MKNKKHFEQLNFIEDVIERLINDLTALSFAVGTFKVVLRKSKMNKRKTKSKLD